MRAAAGISVALAGCALAGCGTSARDQVRAKVEQFANATATRDYRTICDQVLAASLVARLSAAGLSCEQAMQIALGSVQNPTLSIGRINVSGDHATAITLTAAKGQLASIDAIELTHTAHGWRLLSLGSPLKAGQVK